MGILTGGAGARTDSPGCGGSKETKGNGGEESELHCGICLTWGVKLESFRNNLPLFIRFLLKVWKK